MTSDTPIESRSLGTGSRSPESSAASTATTLALKPATSPKYPSGFGWTTGCLMSRLAMLSTPKKPQVVGIW